MSKTIVITGSTKGIGHGLASELLKRGQNVVISGSQADRLEAALSILQSQYPKQAAGCLCDVRRYEDHEQLFRFAREKFERVDIWVNNAGIAHPPVNFWELPLDLIYQVINVNLLGVLHGSRVAAENMLQQGSGWIYNLEGFGSGGRVMAGMSIYGASKIAVAYLSKTLAKELAKTPVRIATLQPGMVITGLVMNQYQTPEALEKVKPIFNIIANRLTDVTPWLAEQILNNTKNGAVLNYQPTWKLMMRFLTTPIIKRNVFDH